MILNRSMSNSFPEFLIPMAATLTQRRFTGPEWMFERKLDGIRMLAFKNGPDVRLVSRNKLPLNGSYPDVADAIATLPVSEVILDGEATGGWGRQGEADYHVFDVLRLDGRDLTTLPLEERQALLRKLPLRLPLGIRAAARRSGTVGARAARRVGRRDRQAPRLAVRTSAVAALAEDEVRADASTWSSAGLPDPQGGRVGLGALLVGYFDGDDLVFAGKVGTGFDTKLLRDLRARFDAMEMPKTPFTKAKGLPRLRVHWVQPEVVVHVGFIEWTGDNKLRHPRLLAVHFDQPARTWRDGSEPRADCRRRPMTVVITHPDKVLFPDDGITKGEMAAYYEAIAPVMLPHIRVRPVTTRAVSLRDRPARLFSKGRVEEDSRSG